MLKHRKRQGFVLYLFLLTFAPLFSSLFINAFGYHVISYYAAAFMTLCLICCLFVKHGDSTPILSEAVSEVVAVED